jgi:hypothetical protein
MDKATLDITMAGNYSYLLLFSVIGEYSLGNDPPDRLVLVLEDRIRVFILTPRYHYHFTSILI